MSGRRVALYSPSGEHKICMFKTSKTKLLNKMTTLGLILHIIQHHDFTCFVQYVGCNKNTKDALSNIDSNNETIISKTKATSFLTSH